MAGLKQLKRVSWAPDVCLRQIRLFLTEEAPSNSRLGVQDHLQAKGSWIRHAPGMGSDDSLPPGFEAPPHTKQLKLSQIPIIKWKCPPRIILNAQWLVVAGEESDEVLLQNQRLGRMVEAIYPQRSAIPSNSSVQPEVENSYHDDSATPLIPITALEDDEASEQLDSAASDETSHQLQQQPAFVSGSTLNSPHGDSHQHNAALPAATEYPISNENPPPVIAFDAEPDVVAAASIAYAAIMSSEEGSPIDSDLLIKILSDPSFVEKLVSESSGTAKQTVPPVATSSSLLPRQPPPPPSLQVSSINPLPPTPSVRAPSINLQLPDLQVSSGTANQTVPLVATSSTLLPHQPPPPHSFQVNSITPLPPTPSFRVPPINLQPPDLQVQRPVKDVNYYKSLIQMHGVDRQVSPDPNPVQFGTVRENLIQMDGIDGEAYPEPNSAQFGKVQESLIKMHGVDRQVSPDPNPVQFGNVRIQHMNNLKDLKNMEGTFATVTQRDQKRRTPKPCAFFNTPKGCRNGASCPYLHDRSLPRRTDTPSKRMKLDNSIVGRL